MRAAVALVLLALAGCALTSKSESTVLRYYTPEYGPSSPGTADGGAPIDPLARSPELRLGRVNAASYLKDRIAFREAEHEVGYYDDARWTEKPEAYLRRALARALFEERAVRQSISGPGPILEINLSGFDEVRGPQRLARVQITWLLRDDRAVLLQRTLTVERPVQGAATPEAAVARALSEALAAAVKGVADAVLVELGRRRSLEGDGGTASIPAR